MGVKINISTEKTLNEEIVEKIESTLGVENLSIQMFGNIDNMTVDVDVEDLTDEQQSILKEELEKIYLGKGKEITSLSVDVPAKEGKEVKTSALQ